MVKYIDMKKALFVLFICLSSGLAANAQTENQNMKVEQTREAYYPEGEDALVNHIFYGIKYSPASKEAKAQGPVMAIFFVNTDSTLSNIRIVKDPGFGIGDSVKEVLEMVKYVPAMENSTPVRSQVMITVPTRAH